MHRNGYLSISLCFSKDAQCIGTNNDTGKLITTYINFFIFFPFVSEDEGIGHVTETVMQNKIVERLHKA